MESGRGRCVALVVALALLAAGGPLGAQFGCPGCSRTFSSHEPCARHALARGHAVLPVACRVLWGEGQQPSCGPSWAAPRPNASDTGLCGNIGPRPTMEDAAFGLQASPGAPRVLGVVDGHAGHLAAATLQQLLPSLLLDLDRDLPSWSRAGMCRRGPARERSGGAMPDELAALQRAAAAASHKVDAAHDAVHPGTGGDSGAVAAAAIVDGADIFLAHVGDVRASLHWPHCHCAAANVALTQDHVPTDPRERGRVLARGGNVTRAVPGGRPRVGGRLAVTRAFGDRAFRPAVHAEPDLTWAALTPHGARVCVWRGPGLPVGRCPWPPRPLGLRAQPHAEPPECWNRPVGGTDCYCTGAGPAVLVLASDGVWDVMGVEDVGAVLRAGTRPAPQEQASWLVDHALARGTSDNVAALVSWIQPPPREDAAPGP